MWVLRFAEVPQLIWNIKIATDFKRLKSSCLSKGGVDISAVRESYGTPPLPNLYDS
jgi:hypothetical protein